MENNSYVLESLKGAEFKHHLLRELEDCTCNDDGAVVKIRQLAYWNNCEKLFQLDNGDVILDNCPADLIKGLVIDGVIPDRLHDDKPVFFLKSPDNKRFCLMRFDSVEGKAVCKYLTLTHDGYYSLFLHYYNIVREMTETC